MRKNIKKLRTVVKNSARRAGDLAAFLGQRLRLHSLSHYHQTAGVHPRPFRLADGEYCLELVTHGRGWVRDGDAWAEVTPGALLWHSAGDETIGRSDFARPYACLALRFTGARDRRRLVPRLTRWEDLDAARQFTREMLRLHVDDRFDAAVLLQYIVGRLYFQVRLYLQGMTFTALPLEVGKVLALIQEQYARPLPVTELARAAGWSAAHLHAKFREHLGLSPHQALMERRVRAAREILSGSNLPVKTVAANCGFVHTAAFCAQFKAATGLSPKAYRHRQFYGHLGKSAA
jgi:AraC-like DNA-binding protein